MYMSNSRSNVPQELRNLGVRNMNITRLDLENRNLTNLPSSIGNLKKLEFFGSGDNRLNSLPESIGKLTKLESLKLSHNQLNSLPRQIGNLKKLMFLALAANKLTSIPKEIGKLTKLETILLGFNKLTSLPDEIGRLPNLRSIYIHSNPNLRIIPRSLDRSGLNITKNRSTHFEHRVPKPIVRRNVPLNTNRNDPISGYNFSVGNNAVNLGYNRYLTEKSLLNWIKTKNENTNITNINTLYSLSPNRNIVPNPFTRQPLFRRNINFVKFVKPNTPNTLSKNLNKMKLNNKPNTIRKKAGNAAQSRRTNVKNNNR